MKEPEFSDPNDFKPGSEENIENFMYGVIYIYIYIRTVLRNHQLQCENEGKYVGRQIQYMF